jgi:alpha-amylase
MRPAHRFTDLAAILVAALMGGGGGGGCAALYPAPEPPAPPPPPPAPAAPAPPPEPIQEPPPPPPPGIQPEDWSDDIVYFVLIDRFADGDPSASADVDVTKKGHFHGGDLKGLLQHLDEIASLGVTALWVNPVVKNIDGFVTGAGFPDYGYHGYWADDFTRLDPRFGSEEELRALVDACHARGIKVLLDVVYNHAGYLSRYLSDEKTKGWLRSNETGTCGSDDITSCVAGLPDFKTELPEVSAFLLDAQIAWARKLKLDGFRLDTVKHVAMDFWKEHRRRTRAELGPGFFLLGEVWGGDRDVLDPYFSEDAMDAGFDFGFQGSAVSFVQGRGRTVAFDAYLRSRHRARKGYHLSQFLSSHDVPGALHQLKGNVSLFRLAAVLQLTTSGIPVIYYGEEVARRIGDWPDNRSDMPWGKKGIRPGQGIKRDEALRADYAKLISIRKAHPALTRGTHRGLATDGDLYVFSREDAASNDAVVVAVNRGAKALQVSVPAPAAWGEQPVLDLFGSGPKVERAGGDIRIAVAGRSARILGVK